MDPTEHILGTNMSARARDTALRHHEGLDGSGCPRGSGARSLDTSQRVVVVAGIIDALMGARSYKDAFLREKTVFILEDIVERGLVGSVIASTLVENYDIIIRVVRQCPQPAPDKYRETQWQYQTPKCRMEGRDSQTVARES